MIFNYPHFMATVYRAYHSRAQFEKYKIVTLHVTLLVLLTGVVMHASPRLFPWIFTLYVFWSPWHYTGQNFGLMMMFVRRERRGDSPDGTSLAARRLHRIVRAVACELQYWRVRTIR